MFAVLRTRTSAVFSVPFRGLVTGSEAPPSQGGLVPRTGDKSLNYAWEDMFVSSKEALDQQATLDMLNSKADISQYPAVEEYLQKYYSAKLPVMRPRKKRRNPFEGSTAPIPYKNLELMSRFVSASGKILPRKITGLNGVRQREVASKIKRLRNMGWLPFDHKLRMFQRRPLTEKELVYTMVHDPVTGKMLKVKEAISVGVALGWDPEGAYKYLAEQDVADGAADSTSTGTGAPAEKAAAAAAAAAAAVDSGKDAKEVKAKKEKETKSKETMKKKGTGGRLKLTVVGGNPNSAGSELEKEELAYAKAFASLERYEERRRRELADVSADSEASQAAQSSPSAPVKSQKQSKKQ